MAIADTTAVFTPLSEVTPSSIFSEKVEALQKAIAQQQSQGLLSPLQAQQYAIQLEWIQTGKAPQLEYILFSNGLINPEPGNSYFCVASGLQVRFCCDNRHVRLLKICLD